MILDLLLLLSPSQVLQWLKEWASVISGLGTLLLTALLAYLYLKQVDTQREQADIQRGQQRLMEINLEPAILLEGYGTHESEHALTLILSNFGNGPALDIGIVTSVELPDERFSSTPTFQGLRILGDDGYGRRVANALRPNQESVEFVTMPVVTVEDDEESETHSGPFAEILPHLHNADVDSFAYTIDVIFSDTTGHEYQKNLLQGEVEVSNVSNFKEMLEAQLSENILEMHEQISTGQDVDEYTPTTDEE